MINRPEDTQVIVALLGCSQIVTRTDTGDVTPVPRVRAIEGFPLDSPEGQSLRATLRDAHERRTGQVPLANPEQ